MEGAPRGRTAGGFGPDAFKCNQCSQIRHNLGELTSEETCHACGEIGTVARYFNIHRVSSRTGWPNTWLNQRLQTR